MRTIVYVDDDASRSVEQLFDADVIALPIAVHHTLISVWNHLKPGTFEYTQFLLTDRDPWFRWASESAANYEELWNYGCDIADEHWHRFGSRQRPPYKHSSTGLLERLGVVPPMLPKLELSRRPITVDEARHGYRVEIKSPYADAMNIKFTHREKPSWL